MSFLLFLRGMLFVLLVFSVTTYVLSGSLWTTVWQTLLCAVIIEVGYFIGLLFMVWQAGGDSLRAEAMTAESGSTLAPDEAKPGDGQKAASPRFLRRH